MPLSQAKTKRRNRIHRKGGVHSQCTTFKKKTRSHLKMSRCHRRGGHLDELKSMIVIADDAGGWWPARPEQAYVYKQYRRDHWPEENEQPNDSFPNDVLYKVDSGREGSERSGREGSKRSGREGSKRSGKYYIGLKYENAYQGGQGQYPRTIMIQDRTGEHQWREINSLFHILQRTPSIKRKINTK